MPCHFTVHTVTTIWCTSITITSPRSSQSCEPFGTVCIYSAGPPVPSPLLPAVKRLATKWVAGVLLAAAKMPGATLLRASMLTAIAASFGASLMLSSRTPTGWAALMSNSGARLKRLIATAGRVCGCTWRQSDMTTTRAAVMVKIVMVSRPWPQCLRQRTLCTRSALLVMPAPHSLRLMDANTLFPRWALAP